MSLGDVTCASQAIRPQAILSQAALLILLPVPLLEVSGVVQIQVLVEAVLRAGIDDLVLGELPVLVQVQGGERLAEQRHLLLGARVGFAGIRDEVDFVA